MFKKILLFILLVSSLFGEFEHSVENTNYTLSQKDYLYNYDRLRFRGDFNSEYFFTTIIVDGGNYLGSDYLESDEFRYKKAIESDTPLNTQTKFQSYESGLFYAKLYRFYRGYEDNDNRVVVGLQSISMGVGRIWTPTNLFNPKNIYALESDEIFGVMGVLYTRHIDDTSDVTFIASQKEDKSFKYASQYKAFLELSDVAIDVIYSNKTTMLGLELEANLADSGVEVRAEVAHIKSNTEEFTQLIVGADYGFANGLTLVGEALYSSKKFSYEEILLNYDSEIASNLHYSKYYTAFNLAYNINIFLDASLTYIESFNDENSRFISSTVFCP